MTSSLLYVSFDGVLQPLGFSQVVRVIVALARHGFPYHLLSVERTRDIEDRANVEHVRSTLSRFGVGWTAIGVDLNGSAARSAEAFARMSASVLRIVRRSRIALVHARGYQSALVAEAAKRLTDIPYLFDARGCWIEERPEWFSTPSSYAAGKFVERHLYRDAKAVVTLTALHAREVVDGAFGRRDATRVIVVPTCADYHEFGISSSRPAKPSSSTVVPLDIQRRLRDKNVIAIVGSLNRSYATDSALRLAGFACEASDTAHLLVLTQQREAYVDALSHTGMSPDRFTVASARHDEMPQWVHWIDWGILLLPDLAAKRGSMPTKLAEFFAAGVRPIVHGCNVEMMKWVRRAGSGFVLDSIDDSCVRMAAKRVVDTAPDAETIARARDITAPHFGLQAGVERYATLLRAIA